MKATLCLIMIICLTIPSFLPLSTVLIGSYGELSGTNFLMSQPLEKNVPSVPIDVELSLPKVPKLGQSSQLVCTVSSAFDAPMTNIQIMLPEGLALVKGDFSWLGDIPANGMIKVKSVIKAIDVGNWTIEATAGYSVTKDSYYGDVDRLYISVSEDSAYVSETPILEYADLAERVDAPPDVAGLPLEGITPNARAPTQKSLPPESPGTLTVTGRFWCYISEDTVPSPGQMRNDELQPMSWGNVWIYRSSDDVYLGGDITGPKDSLEEGYFEISIENPGDAGFYVAMLPWTTAVHVTKPDDSEYTSYTPDFYPSPSATTYDIGGWRPPDQWDYAGAWRIYESIAQDHYDRGAWDFMANEGPGYVPPEVQVRFKMSDGHGTHIHLESGVIDIDTEDYSRALDIVQHEYGHWVMYNAYGGYWPPGAGGPHSINRISNAPTAWTEGWADFFPLACQSYGRWEDWYFEWGTGTSYNLETCPDCDLGDQCEGRVAGALWDVFDSNVDGSDTLAPDGFLNIWDVVSTQTDDTYQDFFDAWRSMGKDRHLVNVCSYYNTIDYNISPALTDGQIYPLPDPIYPDTELVFWVYYRDDDHDPANIVRVYIYDGGWSYYSMDHHSGDPATGEWFYKPLSGFSPGDHDYFFYATDDMDEDYDPDSGYYQFYVSPPPQYTVTFYTNPVTDSPSITFSGTTYTHGQTGSYSSGDYLATANPPTADYAFHHWVYSGSPGVGVYVPNININPTTVEVRGDGWLKAIFSAKITFHTNPLGMGSITYDGSTFVDGDDYWEPNLPPDYGNIRTITANPPTGYSFVSWETTGKISVSDPLSTSTTLTVEGPGVLTANFQAATASITVNPNGGRIYVDGSPITTSTVYTWSISSTHTLDPDSGYSPSPRIRVIFTQWNDGNTSDPRTIHVSGDVTYVAYWKTQYYLTVETNPPGLVPQPDVSPLGEWHDSGTSVTCTAQNVNGYAFDHWTIDGTKQEQGVNPINVTMDQPHNVTAYYVTLELYSLPAGKKSTDASDPRLDNTTLLIDVDIMGSGQVIHATPGQTLSGNCTYQIYSGSNPSELKQAFFIMSWTPSWPPPSGYYIAIYHGGPGLYPGTTVTNQSFSFEAPSTPGTYYLYWCGSSHYSMEQGVGTYQWNLTLPAHAKIIVVELQYTVTFLMNPDRGNIIFNGTSYKHGQNGTYAPGNYMATAQPPDVDYAFHHWEYGGGVYVPDNDTNPTTVDITADGWLKAIFSAKITFRTDPSGIGNITYNGQNFTNGDYIWEVNLPPDYPNVKTIQANFPAGYNFINWTTTGTIYVSDPYSASTTLTVDGPGELTAHFSRPISEVKIDPSVKNVTRGEIFKVNVTVTDVVDLYLWTFSLRWNSSILNITNIAEGPFLIQGGPTFFTYAEINYTGGYVREATCTLLGGIPGVSGSGTIAIITFEAMTEGASPLDLYDVVLLDSLGNAIPTNVVDGEVNVAPPLDLILQNIQLPYSEAKLYANVTTYPISVTIINNGTVDAGAFNVSFSAYWEDGMITEYWNKTRIQNLGAGSTMILQFYFMPQHIGNYTITIEVDCDNDIHPELDETNNTQQILIFATIAGDINTDGKVDYQDLFILARNYGTSPGGLPYHPADFNCDGKIDYQDLFMLARNYGKST